MMFECSAIIFIIIIAAISVLKSSHPKGYAVGILPLVILPAIHMIGAKLSTPISELFPMTQMTAYITVDLVGLVITCTLIGVISTHIKKKVARITYLVICVGFTLILCCVLLVKTVILY